MAKHDAGSAPLNSRTNSLNTNPTLADSTSSDAGGDDVPDEPTAKGDGPLPEELTGRAASTEEDLVTLMANDSADHLTDGFRTGSGDDPETDVDTDDDADADDTGVVEDSSTAAG